MVVGALGLHGQPAQSHVVEVSKPGHVSATAPGLSMVAGGVSAKPATVTAVTKNSAP